MSASSVVLDIAARVSRGIESGMLGLAFHPKFAQNGYAYVYYAHDAGAPDEGTRLARFTSTDGGLTLDPASEKILIEVRRELNVHLGGNVAFGPDGLLYVGLGDGGDPAAAQDTSGVCDGASCTVLGGKMLRIDVDVPSEMTLASYVEDVAFTSGRRTHLVSEPHGVSGVVTLEQVMSVPRATWATTTVGQIETPIATPPSVSPETPLVDVLEAMADAPLVTVRQDGRLLGVIEHDRLLVVLRAHLDVGVFPAPRRLHAPPPADQGAQSTATLS